jgi:hypothetical protein
VPKFELQEQAPKLHDRSGRVLELTIQTLHKSLSTEELFSFQTAIGDGFGDDLIRLHCSKAIEDEVWKFLLAADLTT